MVTLGVQLVYDHSISRIQPTGPMLRSPLSLMFWHLFYHGFGKENSIIHWLIFIYLLATLVAMVKSGGGVRPIAVGCTLCRLVAKIAENRLVEDMAPNWLSGSWFR